MNIKRNTIIAVVAGTLAIGGFAAMEAQAKGLGLHGIGGKRNLLEHLGETLNLTPEQKTKIQPILDQARPQMRTIHEEAMQKSFALIENTMTQVRPLLTPEQQTKLNALKEAHLEMLSAMKKLHELRSN